MTEALNPPLLLIEDEPSVAAYVRAALERNGYAVQRAETGVAALEMLKAGSFLGVITDMRTPGDIDGADVYDWLAQHQPALSKKLVFITGDTVNEETARALERTGAPFIEKPFRVTQLLDVVRQIIGEAKVK
ncbi:MAG TPA: response regulator [Clostridia bacterium]|nr:response regulator [Clostridia bacterium]